MTRYEYGSAIRHGRRGANGYYNGGLCSIAAGVTMLGLFGIAKTINNSYDWQAKPMDKNEGKVATLFFNILFLSIIAISYYYSNMTLVTLFGIIEAPLFVIPAFNFLKKLDSKGFCTPVEENVVNLNDFDYNDVVMEYDI